MLISWNTTQACNISCLHCYRDAGDCLRDELSTQMRTLTDQALAMPGKDAEAKVAAWMSRDDQTLRFTLAMLNELAAQKSLDYPTASVAVQRLAQLASRG